MFATRMAFVVLAYVAPEVVLEWNRGEMAIRDYVVVFAIDALLLGLPVLLYLWGVRTWPGSIVAGLGVIGVWVGGIASIQADESSTAGIGLLGLPVLVSLPVGAVLLMEMLRAPHDA
jgi:hypothetical protein